MTSPIRFDFDSRRIKLFLKEPAKKRLFRFRKLLVVRFKHELVSTT
ncbi:unnamed protein product [Brassica rapa subsp. narinosa]